LAARIRAALRRAAATAINFDPLWHSRGLVQIMAKCGFDSYIFGRPTPPELKLPGEAFVWRGFDGSRIPRAVFPGWTTPRSARPGRRSKSAWRPA
jgi:hypothetical protein